PWASARTCEPFAESAKRPARARRPMTGLMARGGVVRRLVLDQASRVEASAEALADDPRRAGTLHAHRRECRRLAACVDLAEWALKPTQVARAREAVTPLPRGLGRHRDADVLRERLEGTPEVATLVLRDADRGRRKAALRACARARPSALRRPLRRVVDAIPPDAWGDALALPAARVRVRAEHALRDGGETAWHALRLDAKRLRDGAMALGAADAEAIPHAEGADAIAQPLARWRGRGSPPRRPGARRARGWRPRAARPRRGSRASLPRPPASSWAAGARGR